MKRSSQWLVSRTTPFQAKNYWQYGYAYRYSCLPRLRPLQSLETCHRTCHRQRQERWNSELPVVLSPAPDDIAIVPITSGTALPESSDQTGIFRLLNNEERDLLRLQRQLTQQAWSVAANVGVSTNNYAGWGTLLSSDCTASTVTQHQNSSSTLLGDFGRSSIDSTFCVVVAGEYNAGKSTLINALLGEKIVATGSLPTTDALIVITHDEQNATTDLGNTDDDKTATSETAVAATTVTATTDSTLPKDVDWSNSTSLVQVIRSRQSLLQDLTIVDTPGTNAVLTNHTALTVRILPAADLILFVTSADRPFPESERTLLESMATHFRKHVVMVINKMDVLDSTGGHHGEVEKQRVTEYVTEHARSLLGARPVVLAVSARDAWAARQTSPTLQMNNLSTSHDTTTMPSSLWQRSNFASLERFLHETLSTRSKIKAKLSSPVGLTLGLLEECRLTLVKEQDVLASDVSTLHLVQHQVESWQSELTLTLERAVQDMRDILDQEGSRVHVLLARTSLWDFFAWSVWNPAQLRLEWDQTKPIVWTKPVSLPANIISAAAATAYASSSGAGSKSVQDVLLDLVRDTADTVATRGRIQGQNIIEFLGQRPAMRHQSSSLVGSVTAVSSFADTQRSLHDTLSTAVQRHVTMDVESTSSESLLRNLRRTAWLSLLLCGASAGSVAVSAATIGGFTALLEIKFAGMSFSCGAIFGLSSALVFYLGRRYVANSYQVVWTQRSARLHSDATVLCRKEAERMERRIRDGVAPYTRFVDSEQNRLDMLNGQCGNLTMSAQQLQKRIANLYQTE